MGQILKNPLYISKVYFLECWLIALFLAHYHSHDEPKIIKIIESYYMIWKPFGFLFNNEFLMNFNDVRFDMI